MKPSKFRFSNPQITYLEFQTNQGFSSNDKEGSMTVEGINVIKDCDIDKKNASVEFTIITGNKTDESPFYIKLTMMAYFKWDEEYDNEAVESMLKVNAPTLLISYIRPIIANITGQSGLPSFHVPFMNFTDE